VRPADVRRKIITAAVLAVAIALQLTVLNGLRLPGGGVPDLVLVLVAALAMGSGPVAGMAAGFTAGLVLDLAPPGSAVLGEYALVFCLAGFAAGQLRGLASRSALLSLLTLAGVVAVAEAAAAGIELALDPAQVSLAQVRLILPADVICDLLLLPFALLAAMLLGAWATREPATGPQASPNAAAAAVRRAGPQRAAADAEARGRRGPAARRMGRHRAAGPVRPGRGAAPPGGAARAAPGQGRGRIGRDRRAPSSRPSRPRRPGQSQVLRTAPRRRRRG
jgi:rod shape-determining protein MreD